MPTGPNGEKRPADVNACAVTVAKIATGEIKKQQVTVHSGKSKGGRKGAIERARKLTPQRRSQIGKDAANARWSKEKP